MIFRFRPDDGESVAEVMRGQNSSAGSREGGKITAGGAGMAPQIAAIGKQGVNVEYSVVIGTVIDSTVGRPVRRFLLAGAGTQSPQLSGGGRIDEKSRAAVDNSGKAEMC